MEIHLDHEDEILGCRVAAVEGSLATLARVDDASLELLQCLVPAAQGYLVFEHLGTPTALKGIATASTAESTELAFVVTDGVHLPERRSNERMPIQARARISRSDGTPGGGFIESVTENVSLTGVLLEYRDGLEGELTFSLELLLDPRVAPIRCDAVIARQSAAHVGMKFTGMQAVDRARLAVILHSHALA